MRIALITPGFSADEQDWCIPALLNLVRVLAQEHDVHVFTLRYPHTQQSYSVYGATVHPFGGAETTGFGRLFLLQRAIRRIRSVHRDEPFDVVHGFWADEPGFVAVATGRLTGVPAIVSVMGGELVSLPDIGYGGQLGRLNRHLTSMALRGASNVTVSSRYLRDMLRSQESGRGGRPCPPERKIPRCQSGQAPGGSLQNNDASNADRVRSLPMGVDTWTFSISDCRGQGRAPLQGNPAILSVGSLVPVKDHDTLLRAFAGVAETNENAHLHLVGDGPLRGALEHLAGSLGLARKVTFHGDVRHEQVPAYYRSADLLVVSSRHESQSMVALEAVACGCPVVGTAVGILPEICPISANVQPGDAAALSDGVQAMLVSDERRSTMISEALELARTRYSLDQTVRALLALYAEVIGSR